MPGMLDSVYSVQIVKDGIAYAERKTIEFLGGGVSIADDPVHERTKITIGEGGSTRAVAHAETHINGGTDVVDGDRLRIDYAPSSGYTRALAPEATALEDLSSHLHGIGGAVASAQAAATAAQAAAATAQAAADAAASASAGAAIAYHFGHYALNTGGVATCRMWPGWSTTSSAGMQWQMRVIVPDNGNLVSLTTQHGTHPGGVTTVTYKVWLSIDNGVTFTATALTVAKASNDASHGHISLNVPVSRGNMFGIEVSYAGATAGNERLLACVLYKRA